MTKTAAWLTESPFKKVFVAAVSALVFIASIASGGWQLYKSYKESQLKVEIRIQMVTSFATMQVITMAQSAGLDAASVAATQLSKLGANVPTMAAALEIKNPTSQRVTVRACALTVREKGKEGAHKSNADFSVRSIKERVSETPMVLNVDPSSMVIVERVFSFSQAPEVGKALTNTDAGWDRMFEASCLVGDEVVSSGSIGPV